MPLQQTSGNATTDAFGGGVAVVPQYIEDVFSTWLYDGTGAALTVTNNIDLSTKGGLVWLKSRSNANFHYLNDTVRGVQKSIYSNDTSAQATVDDVVTAFNSNGFTLGTAGGSNTSARTYVSWTFREQPKFFDIVTYTGNGTNNRAIAHNLGSTPGCVIVKSTSNAQNWPVYHRSTGANTIFWLNATNANTANVNYFPTAPDSTSFYVGTDTDVNQSGYTYVAYLFAHDAGGFGLTGTDNVISCGSYTGNNSATGPVVTLGYEPQWVMVKQSSAAGQYWNMIDVMRGFDVSTGAQTLGANAADIEYTNAGFGSGTPIMSPTATGFQVRSAQPATNASGATYIYIAIRRGPMKVPTDATKVFSPFTTAAATGTAVTTNFPVDFQLYKYRAGIDYFFDVDRLRGINSTTTANSTKWLDTTSTAAEASATNVSRNWGNTGFEVPGIVGGASNVFYSFQRAPGFFDEVCYTGTGSVSTINHNLGVVPELIIFKNRSSASRWDVNVSSIYTDYSILSLNEDTATTLRGLFDSAPTSTTMTFSGSNVNNVSQSYVAYLFATCAGVSKVGTYTGNGTTQTINCGFTGGARFVLIKRTNAVGDWYVYDTARGMTVLTDPYLLMNSTAAEVATLGSVTTVSTGFALNSSILAAINVNAGTYIFLAIS